ncbi:MAG: HEAT repeat domain-containing protein [Candidatus Zixiibacteriota bacterium]
MFIQIAEGLGDPFRDLSDDNKEKPIDEFIVLSSGKIGQHTQQSISKILRAFHVDKPISFITGEELISLLDDYMPSAFWDGYDYFSKYFDAMKTDFEKIKDISAIGQKEPIPLEKIYVSLRASEKTREREIPIEKEAKILEEKPLEGEKESDERRREKLIDREKVVDADKAVKDHNRLVVVGAPGSGKTTLLKHLALKTCKENLEKQERTCVPIPITLLQFMESGKTLREYIDVVFENYKFPKAKDWVEKDLKDGKCRLLLDGFDELATEPSQEKVAVEIQKFQEKYRKSQIVVTSRVAGYHDELKGFTKLELMEFDDSQIKKFIDNWFGKTDPDKARLMFDAIKGNEQIKALARNPLMIAIVAVIYEEDRKLPQKRAALYERCVEVLLSRWDIQKRLKNVYSSEKKEFILRKLAFYGHINNKRILTEKEIAQEMVKYFPQVKLKEKDAKPFLDEIWQRSYLLRQISRDSYDFLHLSFQEYFTALELKETADGLSVIIEHLPEPWWEEPILLYAGISRDATALIRTIGKKVPEDTFYSNLMLFGKCVADADFTEPALREEIVKKLWDLHQGAEFRPLREKAIEVLGLIKPDNIIDSLTKNLGAKESEVRWSAAYALGSIGSEKAIEPLIEALTKDKESYVRGRAADALGSIGSEKAIAPLIEALVTDEGSSVRLRAAVALGSIGSEKAIEPLIEALSTDEDKYVRWSAAHVLGSIGGEKAIAPLIEALSADEDSDVRSSAADALGRTGSQKAVDPLIEALSTAKAARVRDGAAFALRHVGGEKVIELLIEALRKDKESHVRAGAADALGSVGSGKAIEPLIEALTADKETYVRRRAAFALGSIGSQKAIGPLIKTLTTHEESRVRGRAAEALGRIGSEKAIAPLIEALTTDEESHVRSSAASALGSIGSERAITPLIEALSTSEESFVRGHAADALGSIGTEKAIQPLKKALGDKGEWLRGKVKDAAFASLEKICRRHKIRIPLEQT